MYRCNLQICVIGNPKMLSVIKEIEPFENFTHEFSNDPSASDLIIADISAEKDPQAALTKLCGLKKCCAETIVVCGNDALEKISEFFSELADVWKTPISGQEIRFRFSALQRRLKLDKDNAQSNQYLDTLIDNMPCLVWFKTRDGIHEKVNKKFCEVVGKEREDVLGKRHAYIWGVEEDDESCIASDNKAMECGETVVTEEHIACQNEERDLTSYKTALYDLDGSVMGTVGCALDVTKEREFENEVIEKNKMFERMFASIDCGILQHSVDGKQIYYVNQTALKILGYESVDDMIDHGFYYIADSVAEDDKKRISEQIKQLKNAGDSVNIEYSVDHENKETIHVIGNVKLMYENGHYFYQRYLLDITEQHKAAFEYEQRQEELVRALAANYIVVCSFDLNTGVGSLLHITEGYNNIFGTQLKDTFALEDAVKKYCETHVNEADRELVLKNCTCENIKKEVTEKKMFIFNYRASENNEIKYYQIKAVQVGYAANHFGIVFGIRDVDAELRKEMETNAMLEIALDQANRANEAKSVFLSNMSHDIRTPMNAIIGFTSLALTHIDNQDRVESYLNKIMNSGEHLLSLINDILDMSSIENGKIHLDEKLCSLPEILWELRNMIRPDARKKMIDFKMDAVNVHNENMICDKLRLNQVLLNLLSNAVKYTPENGAITFLTEQLPSYKSGHSVYIFTVSDNGIGMSPEFAEHIFEPFERERNTTASGIQGTGLGMAITKRITDMMNGSINVQSVPNKGTTVTVEFEFKTPSDQDETETHSDYCGKRALVISGDVKFRNNTAAMFKKLGIKAESVSSEADAASCIKQNSYEFYTLDFDLPDINGKELAKQIRCEVGGETPIIAVTDKDKTELEDDISTSVISEFCAKPLFISELKSCLKKLFDSGEVTTSKNNFSYSGRILLAEDNELNQEIALTLLTEAGFEVDVAENGQIAADKVKNSKPGYYKVVLMDVQMPVLNGYEATKQIRGLKNKSLRNIPIIAMTANAFAEDKQDALNAGMNGHLAKPIDTEKLLSALEKVIKNN